MFFNAEHIFMKSGIGSHGEDLYSGRVGDYDSNGLAFIENNLNGYVKVNCSELTGNVYVTGSTVRYYTLTNLSDIRFKKAVKKVPYGLNELLDLNPISFKYKLPENDSIQDEDKVHFGFSAQDVQSIMPELVVKGERLTVATTEMIPVLINAIKELQSQINNLKNRI